MAAVTLAVLAGACSDQVPGENTFHAAAIPAYTAVSDGRVDVEGGLIAVAARTPGIVDAIYVGEGDLVTKGQPLARLDAEGEMINIEESHAQIRLARAQWEHARLEADGAMREFRRIDALRDTLAVAAQQIDQARDAAGLARIKLDEQTAQLAVLQAALRRALFARDQKLVVAPASGAIAQSFASVGTGVSTLNVSTLFTIAPDTPRIVRAEVTENSLQSVRVGEVVEISPESDKSKHIAGVVKRISPVFGARRLQSDQTDQRTDERVVEVIVATQERTLLIGQRVLVRFK